MADAVKEVKPKKEKAEKVKVKKAKTPEKNCGLCYTYLCWICVCISIIKGIKYKFHVIVRFV